MAGAARIIADNLVRETLEIQKEAREDDQDEQD